MISLVIPNPRTPQTIHEQLLICQMIGVSHDSNAHTLAGFVLELGRDLVAYRRNLISHQNVIRFERLSLLQESLQLGIQFRTLFVHGFKSGQLLLERCTYPSLLACRLVEGGQSRQLAGMIRVDLGDASDVPALLSSVLRESGC